MIPNVTTIQKNLYLTHQKNSIMKNYLRLFTLSVTMFALTVSCSNQEVDNDFMIESTHFTRSAQNEALAAEFNGQTVTIEAADILPMVRLNTEQSAEAEAISIGDQANMLEDKAEKVLDLALEINNDKADEGFLMLSLESSKTQKILVEVSGSEGYVVFSKNEMELNEGSNYKALDVLDLENGAYKLILKDLEGNKLEKAISVNKKK